MKHHTSTGRTGFTMTECAIALGVLATVATLAAQLGTWAIIERGRDECHLVATEAAANVLEQARTVAWSELTPEWAGSQNLPAAVADRLHDGKLTVSVTPEADRRAVKRVDVKIEWDYRDTRPPERVSLVALLADRSAGGVR
jgi:prepilin-type N-terminal cleavage/methylation domain-containing protein